MLLFCFWRNEINEIGGISFFLVSDWYLFLYFLEEITPLRNVNYYGQITFYLDWIPDWSKYSFAFR